MSFPKSILVKIPTRSIIDAKITVKSNTFGKINVASLKSDLMDHTEIKKPPTADINVVIFLTKNKINIIYKISELEIIK
jgi:hypothetical protein